MSWLTGILCNRCERVWERHEDEMTPRGWMQLMIIKDDSGSWDSESELHYCPKCTKKILKKAEKQNG